MAKSSGSRENWKLNDYIRYFIESKSRLNSEEFDKIRKSAQTLVGIEDKIVTTDTVYERNDVLQKLIGETFEYVNSHNAPKTSFGRERRDIVNEFMKLCVAEKKQMENSKFTEFYNGKTFYETTREITYEELTSMETAFKNLETEAMTEDHVITYTNAVSRYIQACEFYLEALPLEVVDEFDKNIRTSIEKNLEKYKPCVDSMRDLRTIRAMISDKSISDQKKWKDLLELHTKEVTIDGKLEKTGANASERIKITVNGKQGFFTKENYTSPKEYAQQMMIESFLDAHKSEDNYASRDAITQNLDIFNQYKVDQSISWNLQTKDVVFHTLCKEWDQMEDSSQKDSLRSFLKEVKTSNQINKTNETNSKYKDLIISYSRMIQEAIPEELDDPTWKKKTYLECVSKQVADKALAEKCAEYGDLLMNAVDEAVFGPKLSKENLQCIKLNNHIYATILHADPTTEAGKKTIEARRALLDRDDLKLEFASVHAVSYGTLENHKGAYMDERDNTEMSGRNVATTRIAELLGIGEVVAHSEKMNVTINGEKVSGCFMEFAKGFDKASVDSLSLEELDYFNKVNTNVLSAGLVKSGAALHLLDVICGQKDRHSKNFFMQFEEQNGELVVSGVQGIDNDRAFGRHFDANINDASGRLNDLRLIDASVAERIMKIGREELQYAVGDILSEAEIAWVQTRIDAVKDLIKENKLLKLKDNDWNLDFDPYKGRDPETLSPEEKKYKDAVSFTKKQTIEKDKLQVSPISRAIWNVKEIQGMHKKKVQELKTNEERREKKLAEIDARKKKELTSVSDKKIIEPIKKSEEEMRAKRAAIFDKLVAGRESASKVPVANEAKSEAKAKESKVLTSAKELSSHQKASERGPLFAPSKTKVKTAEPKELDLGFTEITKQDIKDANKNVKKPIIGGHRKK